uniref:VWA domain-containing protein n=1 Tax=Shewanella sp. TaxID=50422 RepID=UPI004047619C
MKNYQQAVNHSLLALIISGIMIGGCGQAPKDAHQQPQTDANVSDLAPSTHPHALPVSHTTLKPQHAEMILSAQEQAQQSIKDQIQSNRAKTMAAVMPMHSENRHLSSAPINNDKFATLVQNGNMVVSETPVSTFSIDVDTGNYSTMRRMINQGLLPAKDSVRIEELINYFSYDYPAPTDAEVPFNVTTELAPSPYNLNTQLLRIGIKGFEVAANQRGASNLVFLLDVSGSMSSNDKLPLLKQALLMLSQQLSAQDKVSIVAYRQRSGFLLGSVCIGSLFSRLGLAYRLCLSEGIAHWHFVCRCMVNYCLVVTG